MKTGKIDKPFLAIVVILALGGFFIFSSASLGLLAREGSSVGSIALSQGLGLLLGFALMFGASRIPYQLWNKYAIYFFLFTIGLTLLVFVPNLGITHGGATRWLDLGPLSFQPSELLKLGFVVYLSAWFAGLREKIHRLSYGILPMIVTFLIVGSILAFQPDADTFIVMAATGIILFISAGGRWFHAGLFSAVSAGVVIALGYTIPYIRARLDTFFHPGTDPFGSSYQIDQSLIAIGSGKIFGRGFGQSIQKFNYLPEPVGDSIFAVFAEEWGFVGAVVFLFLMLAFALRGLKIAGRAPSMFSGLLVTGIISLITIQSLINIAAMLAVFPLTGMPLLFVSQGGTALMVTLLEVGIVLGVARSTRKTRTH